ncbi:hypothetical protein C3747_7g163 [Trypanosoma cruzi]|uniref:Uncharacterized protein n=2 Tax=Trypanosoma cruzi TaxID=5693 RepID=Q4D5W4_TRYCC|nr:hypothetical protein, conserved [Trypanosoma cruzi]EAN87916.1 hypothetical protein, conserved [Trypanosoma cruzi]KAF5223012.1 hypothetical protein ECC02_003839 [Trypanosoma cruzi]PWV20214.1 hypothetical protein C3747_7g163 [Trypanosoma cruzi]|eukprot:XP_809767.1 hypothetical protein [Trypanosoma cruzi strain CL Brener]
MFLDEEQCVPEACLAENSVSQKTCLQRPEGEPDRMEQSLLGGHGAKEIHPSWRRDYSPVNATSREENKPRSSLSDLATSAMPNHWEDERTGNLLYELRRIVPHLSPEFDCGERDATLILSVIRSGSAAEGTDSWEHRLSSLEAEKRMIQSRLDRRSHECEELKGTVAELRQKLRATQENTNASVNVLSKRREELRKQLLLEESRSQKLKIRNGQLEMELERLKEMLRSRLSK